MRGGQSLHLYCSCGDTIVAVRGAVEINGAPVWLGEHMLRTKHEVPEGGAHVVRQDGWLCVFASGDAEVACIAAESRMRALLDRVLAALHRMMLRARASR